MDDVLIQKIKDFEALFYNNGIEREGYEKELRKILKGKNIQQVMETLKNMEGNSCGKKNQIVLLTILALLAIEDIETIQKLMTSKFHELLPVLKGGFIELLLGKSPNFNLKAKISKVNSRNMYDMDWYLYRELFYVLKIISDGDRDKFFEIIRNPECNFFGINILVHHAGEIYFLEDELEKILKSTNEVLAEAVFNYKMRNLIEKRDIDEEMLSSGIKDLLKMITCRQRKVSFIGNYIVERAFQKNDFSPILIETLFDEENSDYLINYLEENQEKFIVRVLERFVCAANSYFKDIESYNEERKNEIYDIFYQRFLDDYKGKKLCSGEQESIKYIVSSFSDNQKDELRELLKSDDKDLFFTDMDRLIRVRLYESDDSQHRLINQIMEYIG